LRRAYLIFYCGTTLLAHFPEHWHYFPVLRAEKWVIQER